uniref:Solute carrier family 12 member 3 n=1 Tax=Strongyloides stercoralis TaxID=6248 RepID=A0AAF5D1W6_STRER
MAINTPDVKGRCFSDDFVGSDRNSIQLNGINGRGRTNSCFTTDDDVTLPMNVNDFSKGSRPTLKDIIKKVPLDDELQNDGITNIEVTNEELQSSMENGEKKFEGFGWVKGVLIRCILCIIGATLYLRMSWIAGQAGILLGICVILLALLVVVITAVSMSAIATNGEIKNGGCYYLISRSLGPEFGGSIGLILYIANTVNGAMNCVGLGESIVFLLKDYNFYLIDGGVNDVRIYSLSTCIFLQGIIFIGTEFENKTQILLLITITLSILSHTIGAFLPVSVNQMKHGIVGLSWQAIKNNMWPDFRNGNSFITAFGVYFPAMTGIMAGANMSGDLKDASKSIPIGTMTAIAITTGIYSVTMLLSSVATVRDSDGISLPMFSNVTGQFIPPPCYLNNTCKFGLANDYQVPLSQAAFGPLIIAGIIASTLSSASGCLIGAPRIFQALCQDDLFPGLSIFGKGRGPTNEPYPAYFLTFFLTCCINLIGDLNAISEIITNFFLAAFAITNFACFDSTASHAPGFRPGFKYYNKWLSLFGSILCISLMFVLSWVTSLMTLFIFAVLYLYLKHTARNVNWGSSTEANRYRIALMELLKLSRHEEHVKNYRPQMLVLTGNPAARQCLVDFAYCISAGQNLMICGHVVPYESSVSATECIRCLNVRMTDWLREQKTKAFYCGVANKSLRNGVQGLLQTVGLGKMQPNILMIGFKTNWLKEVCRDNEKNMVEEYLGVILDAFESNMSICIFRNGNDKLDHSMSMTSAYDNLLLQLPEINHTAIDSGLHDDYLRGVEVEEKRPVAGTVPRKSFTKLRSVNSVINLTHHVKKKSNVIYSGTSRTNLGKKFRCKIRDGDIDVWWLNDDGGLTLLIPHLIAVNINSYLHGANVRIFIICADTHDPRETKEQMEKMLKKFRITFNDVIVLVEQEIDLYRETVDEYNSFMEILNPAASSEKHAIDAKLLQTYDRKIKQQLRLRELLLEHSAASHLVIVTLPIVHESAVMSPLYMLWLELLTKDMPPTLLVRGNHSSINCYDNKNFDNNFWHNIENVKMNEKEYNKVLKAHIFQYNNAISSLLGVVGKEIFENINKRKKIKIINCLKQIEESYNLKKISNCIINMDSDKFIKHPKKWLLYKNKKIKTIQFDEKVYYSKRYKRNIPIIKLKSMPNLKDPHQKYEQDSFKGVRDFFVNIANIVKNRKRKIHSWSSLHNSIMMIHKQFKEFKTKNNYRDKVLSLITGNEIRHSSQKKISSQLKEHFGTSEPSLLIEAHSLLDSFQRYNKESFYKILSPTFLPVYEKDNNGNTRNILSPNLFPLYTPENKDSIDSKYNNVLPIPYILKHFGIDKKNRDNILEMIMEISGASESIEDLFKKINNESKGGMMDDITGLSETIKNSFDQLEKTFTNKQKRELNNRMYTFMTKKQIEYLFGKNGIYKTDNFPFDIDNYETWTEVEKRKALINTIYNIADIKSRKREKRQIILSPFAFSPTILHHTILAPVILSPSIFSPSIFGPLLLSPPIASPQIGNPLIFSPYVLGPNILSAAIFNVYVFSPYVLSPNIINPYVLSPIILSPHVLCPDILSPTILSGAILNPFVMSPAIFTESALAADILSPSILSSGG